MKVIVIQRVIKKEVLESCSFVVGSRYYSASILATNLGGACNVSF